MLGLAADYVKDIPFTGMAVNKRWAAANVPVILAATSGSLRHGHYVFGTAPRRGWLIPHGNVSGIPQVCRGLPSHQANGENRATAPSAGRELADKAGDINQPSVT
jgi:hypothetical protein